MKDKPIIFSGPMVRALLEGRKTQTRRVLPSAHPKFPRHQFLCTETLLSDTEVWYWDGVHEHVGASYVLPYAPGDRLWVREAWRARDVWDDDSPRHIHRSEPIQHEATDPKPNGRQLSGRKRPSIHMPRWASRLTLTVTDVRVQRLQEISEEEAKAEGVEPYGQATWKDYTSDGVTHCTLNCRSSFRTLWNSINGPDAWDANPWVVALTFDVHRCNIDAMKNAA